MELLGTTSPSTNVRTDVLDGQDGSVQRVTGFESFDRFWGWKGCSLVVCSLLTGFTCLSLLLSLLWPCFRCFCLRPWEEGGKNLFVWKNEDLHQTKARQWPLIIFAKAQKWWLQWLQDHICYLHTKCEQQVHFLKHKLSIQSTCVSDQGGDAVVPPFLPLLYRFRVPDPPWLSKKLSNWAWPGRTKSLW